MNENNNSLLLKSKNERKTCQYYPCHFKGQDCTFCYCHYYPCLDFRTGGKYNITKNNHKNFWDCSLCKLVHLTQTKDKILDYLIQGDENVDRSWEEIIIPLLKKKLHLKK